VSNQRLSCTANTHKTENQKPPHFLNCSAKQNTDALTELPPLPEFKAALAPRSRAKLKALLLDQGFLAGIGNWVADEVLYQARLHPEQAAGEMGDEHVARLHAAIAGVLRFAVDARADAAKYPLSWLFHSRWTDKKAGRHEGRHMAILTVGGRTSAYVPELQKLVRGGNGGSNSGGNSGGGKAAAAADGKQKAAAAKGAKPKAAAGKRPRKEEGEEEDDGGGSGEGGEGGGGKAGKATPRRAPSKAAASKKGGGGGGGSKSAPASGAQQTSEVRIRVVGGEGGMLMQL
jgi:formamidopyrimidine-DNA glycosylase